MKAEDVYYNLIVYRLFLFENLLPDDSSEISIEDLMYYVKNEIDDDDYFRLLDYCKNKY